MFVDHVSYMCPVCGKQRWHEVRWANAKDRVHKHGLLQSHTPICGVCVCEAGLWLLENQGTNEEAVEYAKQKLGK